MITENELKISNESPIHRDFYQLYPEILELVNKITERWDPTSSNESDPGVVILKLLAFLGDKLNYNIDKNILECFMPSATQEDSMRKLCDMMGYDMHYYRSATTPVSFMWVGTELDETPGNKSILIPKFSSVSNYLENDSNTGVKQVTYVLTEDVNLTYRGETVTKDAIEGQLVDFVINDSSDNIVRLYNISNNRLYFPESQIAENGVWIFNLDETNNLDETIEWTRTTNLNTHVSTKQKPYWKFCYDSKRKLPYILFPDNLEDIIDNGLKIKYIRTSGVNGNITAELLTTLLDTKVIFKNGEETSTANVTDDEGNANLIVKNPTYTTNGANIETLDEAYDGFKHTIGTFDTLVTCRDYANAIYQMVSSDTDYTNYVSNVQVSDIRDDLNYTNKIVTFGDYGIIYEDVPTETDDKANISHYDIYMYPLNPAGTLYTAKNYQKTFQPNYTNSYSIKADLEDYKTISHEIKQVPNIDSTPYLIKNYYHLAANITTTYKVSKYEWEQIKNNIAIALYKNFNARKLEYGEEIPFDTIYNTIKTADARIKSVSLDNPDLKTKLMFSDTSEVDLSASASNELGKIAWYKYAAKNVLAGKIPLFNYNTDFDYTFGETNISGEDAIYGSKEGTNYPESASAVDNTNPITAITTNLMIPNDCFAADGYVLKENESIQLKAPNIVSKLTYPVSINYYFHKADPTTTLKQNTDYKLVSGDILYINYTDSNNTIHWVTYYPTYYTDSTLGESNHISWAGIIRASFELQDSNTNPASYNRKSDQILANKPTSWATVDGIYTLTNTDQIEIRDYVRTAIKNYSPFYCYWSTNDSNKLIFKKQSQQPNSDNLYSYSYTLSSNEYFFYTDKLKNSLITLGSGTTLTLKVSDGTNNQIVWTLSTTSENTPEIDLDTIASKGIGAFADTNWHVEQLVTGRQELEIQENQLIIFGEDDRISISILTDDITSEWSPLDLNVLIEKNGQPIASLADVGLSWEIRAILDINIGPETIMTLKHTADGVKQELYLESSTFDESGNETIIDSDYFVGSFSSESNDVSVKSNYLVQSNGGKNISMARYALDGNRKDDLLIYNFDQQGVTGTVASGESGETKLIPLNDYKDNYTTVDMKDYSEVTLPVYLPENTIGIFMVYYSLPESESGGMIKLRSGEGSCLCFYKDHPLGDSEAPYLDLIPNTPNIIRVSAGGTLTLDFQGINSGSVIFSNIDIVNVDEQNNKAGVNYKLLNIDSSQISAFLTTLKSTNGADNFLYNVPINNSHKLDVTKLDEYSWFNYNNVCNKFVLAEIDTNLEDVRLADSSKLGGRW